MDTDKQTLRSQLMLGVLLMLGLVIFSTDGFGVPFIRNYAGDVVVVMFLFFLGQSFTSWSARTSIIVVAVLAMVVEILQVIISGGGSSSVRDLTLGTTFDPWDLLMYAVGLIAGLAINRWCESRTRR